MMNIIDTAIIGSGALGIYYGGLLANAEGVNGLTVHFLVRSDFDQVASQGFTVYSTDGDYRVREPRVYRRPQDMPVCDLIVVGIKTTANGYYRDLIEPVFSEEQSVILCLQNGIGNEDQLARFFPAPSIMGGVAFLCSNRTAPGVIHHTDYGHMHFSPFVRGGLAERRASELEEKLKLSKVNATYVGDYLEMRWRKQVWNVPFNALCTLYDCGTESLLQMKDMENRVRSIMHEVIALARELHRVLPDYGVERPNDFHLNESFIEDQIMRTRTMGEYLPSMLLDRREGRPLEMDAIVGACVEMKKRYRLKVSLGEIERLDTGLRNLE